MRQAHATNVLSVYKCLLLNNGLLRSKSVAYNPVLSRFEDIALSHAAVAAGLKTLKCYGYSYTAANLQRGGCQGGTRARHARLQRLRSRPLSTRFG